MLTKITKWTVLMIATIALTISTCGSTIFAAATAAKTPSWGSWDDTTITYKVDCKINPNAVRTKKISFL